LAILVGSAFCWWKFASSDPGESGAEEERPVHRTRTVEVPVGDEIEWAVDAPHLENAPDRTIREELDLADPSQPAAIADRALDGLLAVSETLQGADRAEARARARRLADLGEPSVQATALHLLAELGSEDEDRSLLEASTLHPDVRVSLAAKRALFEHLTARGDAPASRELLSTLIHKEENP